ncbi:hypothetical protein [Aphanothece sacrum]|uniref:Uncharacterized protein n=1 Tax=Aphanothece sacrum FPU1 TaxID=1920663 RepID=A0A401IHD5_APHSA|nr:hypothetical protein [Aphanothece sacrum]GBF80702.1 hypothetical protein AsFPU1_2106 [Aphanothece sacrum FPU1]GBF83196.1 hypothetical protein AsFPU3_0235 [Aphanothece sacrum FPU3]
MLTQIVRPLVQTQVRLLANSQATQTTLIDTISRWLGYLGVDAKVTKLASDSEGIHVSITVGKPDSCETKDWQKILDNLRSSSDKDNNCEPMNGSQELQLARLLAYLIQAGNPNNNINWNEVENQLQSLQLDHSILSGIQSALKVPQPQNLLDKLDPDVAASAFPFAVKIAWFDQQINPQENHALSALLCAMK